MAGSVGVLLLLAGLLPDSNRAATKAAATSATAAPTTSAPPPPSTSAPPPPTTQPPTTVAKAAVPDLVGTAAGQAETALSRRGLRWTLSSKATGRSAPGTVISQSRRAGDGVLRGTVVVLVVAKAPPPPATTAPRNCDPAYPDVCLHDGIGDYDCEGGSGDGPNYVRGPIRVLPPDPFDLDGNDNDGIGCESG